MHYLPFISHIKNKENITNHRFISIRNSLTIIPPPATLLLTDHQVIGGAGDDDGGGGGGDYCGAGGEAGLGCQ